MTESADEAPEPGPDTPDEVGDGFADLGLRPALLDALTELGYEEPTPIQREAIPPLIAGSDLLGQAATGTGKTAAFALPILERVAEHARSGNKPETLAIVLVPTRELAMQVSEAIYKYGRGVGAKVVPVYGGQPIGRQIEQLKRGAHVVVATPGRAIDHINRRTLKLDGVELVVLDEADEMLDMGFAEDIESILGATPDHRQTVLFSATMPPRIDAIARRHLQDPIRIRIERDEPEAGESPLVRQSAYVVARFHKAAALGRILDVEAPEAAIVFCRTRHEVDQLTETLNGRGYRAEALHGGMSQEQRDRVMGRMRSGTAELLIATDVAARGLDLDNLTHVVNYDVPSAPEAYVHRIGRVGRAGREGVAITLAEPRERRLLGNIERLTRQKFEVEKIPTVADLRARQMEATIDVLREALEADDFDRFRGVVDTLSEDFELNDIALAATKLLHQASGNVDDEQEIPDASVRAPKPDRQKSSYERDRPSGGASGSGSGSTSGGTKPYRGDKERGPARPARDFDGPTAKLYVGVGRGDGVQPKDLVGAIAGETELSGRDIGAIRIFDRFSIVEVPDAAVDAVIADMAKTTIKGKKAPIRRDRGDHS